MGLRRGFCFFERSEASVPESVRTRSGEGAKFRIDPAHARRSNPQNKSRHTNNPESPHPLDHSLPPFVFFLSNRDLHRPVDVGCLCRLVSHKASQDQPKTQERSYEMDPNKRGKHDSDVSWFQVRFKDGVGGCGDEQLGDGFRRLPVFDPRREHSRFGDVHWRMAQRCFGEGPFKPQFWSKRSDIT